MIDSVELERRLLAVIDDLHEHGKGLRPTLRARRASRGAAMLPQTENAGRQIGLYLALEIEGRDG
jgi:hypothetical protein